MLFSCGILIHFPKLGTRSALFFIDDFGAFHKLNMTKSLLQHFPFILLASSSAFLQEDYTVKRKFYVKTICIHCVWSSLMCIFKC
jgi:hypothetical protein